MIQMFITDDILNSYSLLFFEVFAKNPKANAPPGKDDDGLVENLGKAKVPKKKSEQRKADAQKVTAWPECLLLKVIACVHILHVRVSSLVCFLVQCYEFA